MSETVAIHETIVAANEEFMAAFNSGDAAGVAAFYTEDAQLLPPNADVMAGKEAIQAFWQGAMDMGCKECSLEIVELLENGDMVIEIGNYILIIQLAEGETITDKGKYLVVWKQEDGAWRLDIDIWNSSLPVPS